VPPLDRARARALAAAVIENDVLFFGGALAAFLWANVSPGGYEAFASPLRFGVNEILMTLFFGLAAKEVLDAIRPGGPLGSWRGAALPLVATVGGMAGPALVYLALAQALGHAELRVGWAIPCATDIAFAYLVARAVFPEGHAAIPFLLILAIADDAGGLAVLAFAYPRSVIHPLPLLLVVVAVLAGLSLRRFGVKAWWAYLACAGIPSWFGLEHGGVQPALALVPVVATMPDSETLARMERALALPVALILGLFGLVNAGVPLGHAGPATLCVSVALLAGKPLGISLATWLGARAGLALPPGLRARDVLVLGVTAGIGFTVALFVATVAFEGQEPLDAAKMGALASVAAGPVAIVLGRLLRVKEPA
jgi:NhaA family Na+:H+ antiporter